MIMNIIQVSAYMKCRLCRKFDSPGAVFNLHLFSINNSNSLMKKQFYRKGQFLMNDQGVSRPYGIAGCQFPIPFHTKITENSPKL